MKKIYTILSVLLISSSLFAQVEITNDSDNSAIVNGSTVIVSGDEALTSAHLHIKNISGSSIDFRWKRTVISTDITSLSDQICDDDACFVCNGTTWTGSNILTVANSESTTFLPKIYTNNGGNAHLRYYVLDGGNNDAIIDSVDVKFTTFVSLSDNKVDFSVYPNPVNNVLNVSISENNTSISIFDIVGKNVAEMNLVNGKNTLNIENLNPGVYFYSIKRNGNVIETKKLIVK